MCGPVPKGIPLAEGRSAYYNITQVIHPTFHAHPMSHCCLLVKECSCGLSDALMCLVTSYNNFLAMAAAIDSSWIPTKRVPLSKDRGLVEHNAVFCKWLSLQPLFNNRGPTHLRPTFQRYGQVDDYGPLTCPGATSPATSANINAPVATSAPSSGSSISGGAIAGIVIGAQWIVLGLSMIA